MSAMNNRLLRPRASGFNPRSISGLSMWLDATQGVTLTSSLVSTWADSSGNGRDVTQTTAARRPTYTKTLNGRSVLSFDAGITQFLSRAGIANADYGSADGITFFLVFRVASNLAYTPVEFSPTNNAFDRFSSGTSYPGNFRAARLENLSLGMPDTGSVLYSQVVNVSAGTHVYRRQRNQMHSGAADYATWQASTNQTLRVGQAATSNFTGDIAEVITYNRPLSASEITRVENSLTSKWGLT